MDDHVVVKTYWKPTFAHRAATELEDSGIAVDVVDDEIVSADPLLANAIGGVKLRVHEADAARAREILDGARDGTLDDDSVPESADFDALDPEEREEWEAMTRGLRCPECGSESVGFEPLTLIAWLVVMVGLFSIGLTLPSLTPGAAFISGSGLLAGGVWLLIFRKFPLACKECQHWGERERFDPRYRLD